MRSAGLGIFGKMALDFNDAPQYGRKDYNADQISYALQMLAPFWVPEVFKNGRINSEGGARCVRCANIKGDPPSRRGSCRIWIDGEHAGSWVDFQDQQRLKGQPISTIKEHFGLDDGMAFEKCIEIINYYDGEKYLDQAAPAPQIPRRDDRRQIRVQQTIDHYTAHRRPAPGSIVETYWRNRKLGDGLPMSAFGSIEGEPDLMLVPDATHYDYNRAYPAMLNRLRYPDGQLTGAIHMTYLKPDGSGHIGVDKAKMVWGSFLLGGLIMLMPIGPDGTLGIGEGVETTAAGIRYFGCAGWAAVSTSGMVKFGQYLAENGPAVATGPIKRLLIWADAGKDGEASAQRLAELAHAGGVPAIELYLPGSGDDLAADLVLGLPSTQAMLPYAQPAAIATVPAAAPLTHSALSSRLMAMSKETDAGDVSAAVRDIASASLDAVVTESLYVLLSRRTGTKRKAINDMAKGIKAEIISPDRNSAAKPWKNQMQMNDQGEPKGIMSNVALLLREAAETRGALGHNEFTGMISVLRKWPWEQGAGNPCHDRPWTDEDELAMVEWVQQFAGIHAQRNAIFDAVQRVAYEYKYHPVKEMLDDAGDNWDHEPRVDYAAVRYLGAKDIPYNREVFKRWLLSAVARVYRPGVKADCMTVFEGPQGIRKSTAMRVLFDPWFTDQASPMGTKDASLEIRGVWCIEYSELEAMSISDTKAIKSFMTRTDDRFRPPYGRMIMQLPRQTIFGGTTNDIQYLKDSTGARRFWTIRCGYIDIEGMIRDRDQIWGEIVHIFKSKNSQWWIDQQREPELAAVAAQMTEARYQSDSWEDVILSWIGNNGRANVTMAEVLRDALEIQDKSKWSKSDQIRVGKIMNRIAWIRARDRGGMRLWRYWRPDMINHDLVEVD